MIAVSTERRRLWLGYLAALGAAAAYGVVAVIARKIVIDFAPPLVGTAFSLLFGTIVVLILFQGHARADYAARHPKSSWIYVGLAGLAATWGVGSWFLALGEAPVVLVAPVTSVYPLVAIVLTHVFLQRLERITMRTVAGAILVVIGVTFIALGAS